MALPGRPQPLLIRITHWVTVPVLVIMAMSGLQILRAYPYFGPRGEPYTWVPLQGWDAPAWMRAGQWLAGARHLHFAFAWWLVVTGAVYVGYLAWSGAWRERLWWPSRAPRTGASPGYSRRQRVAYTIALVLGVVEVMSGLAIWKPVQLHYLAWLMGGYDGARVVHFLALLGLGAFVVVHVAMVLLRPRTIVAMVTGGARRGAPER